MLRLFDTAAGVVTDVGAREGETFGLYVCGPTVYGEPHIGHGRLTLAYDVLRRYLEFRGVIVDHVSNVTDIDDKIIARAADEGRTWSEVAAECEQSWWSAMGRMGVLEPTHVPHATEYVAEMVEMISRLVALGTAYEIDDGIYLATAKVDGYGLLAHQELSELRPGERVALDDAKQSPTDFVLWKKAKPGEPTWPSPWGPGRPGWHAERVAMSLGLLGDHFALHGGGADLRFPHHENERAQAVVLGYGFARHWSHVGLVETGGKKMSKSLGNFTTLRELLDETDPRAYRVLVVQAHYRSPLEVTPEGLSAASGALRRLDALARRFANAPGYDGTDDRAVLETGRFVERMDDDLDTPGAVARLFEVAKEANSLADSGDEVAGAAAARSVLMLFGVLGIVAAPSTSLEQGEAMEEIDDVAAGLVAERDDARRGKDFARELTRSVMLLSRVDGRGHGERDTNPPLRPAGLGKDLLAPSRQMPGDEESDGW